MNRGGLLALALSGPQPSAQDVQDLLAFHKSWVPAGATMTGPDGDPTGGGGQSGTGAATGSTDRTFTQDDLTRVAAREKSEGERAGRKALLESLGLPADTKPEDLKARLDAQKQAEEAQKTAAERAKDEADAREVAAKQREDAAAAERHAAAVERHLVRAGVGAGETDDEKVAKAIERAAKLVEVEQGADATAIAVAVADLKKDMPALFTATATASGDQPGSDPNPKPRPNPTGKSAVSKGREEAIARGWIKPEKQTA